MISSEKGITVLSLFDGISCGRVALERAGFKVEKYYASEIDKYAIQIAQKNYPDTVQVGDIRTVNTQPLTEKGIDLIIGGSPCQDLSIAKANRKGLKGERSGLFYEYLRIMKQVKPKLFILENVNSMPKEAKEEITKEIWGIEPVMINAALVSAQNRKRLFWVGELINGHYEQVQVPLPENKGILLKDILEPKISDEFVIKEKSNTIRTFGRGSEINDKHNWDMIRIIKPVALRNRGEGKKPEYNKTDKANALTTVQTDSMVEENTIIRKLTPIECERLQCLPDNYTEGISYTQRYKCLGNAFNVDVVAHILKHIL